MGPITCIIIGCLSLCYNVSDSNISIYQDTCMKNEHNASYTYEYSIPSSPSSSSLINSDIKETRNIKLPRKILQETSPKEYKSKGKRRIINNTLHRKLLRYDYIE